MEDFKMEGILDSFNFASVATKEKVRIMLAALEVEYRDRVKPENRQPLVRGCMGEAVRLVLEELKEETEAVSADYFVEVVAASVWGAICE